MTLPHRLHAPGGFPDWVAEGRFDPTYRSIAADQPTGPQPLYFVWQDNRILQPQEGSLPLQQLPDGLIELRRSLIGRLDGQPCYAIDVQPGQDPVAANRWVGLRSLFGILEAGLIAVAGRSFQILEWERTHQFCGRCATPMRLRGHERARECPACGFVAYPRISPVVMGLVVRGPELLLARSPHFAPGMYSAVAGFVEVGESLEQALVREIQEETGIQAGNFQYFSSQPWPFPHSLMVAYTAEYLAGEPVPQPDEIEDVQWFRADTLPLLPPVLSIAGRLIRAVADHLVQSHALQGAGEQT